MKTVVELLSTRVETKTETVDHDKDKLYNFGKMRLHKQADLK